MSTPSETVRDFFHQWGKGIDPLYASIHEYFAPDCVWENVGLSRTVGPAEAEAVLRSFEPMKVAQRMDVEMLELAASGTTVLCERVDRVIDGAGNVAATVRCAGVLEIRDGKIAAWRDYFDTVPFAR